MKINQLPEDFEIARDYSIFLNNIIASTFNSAVDAKIFNHDIKFKSRGQLRRFMKKTVNSETGEYQKFFLDNNIPGDLYFITIKNVLRAVILDLHKFLFEAIENIKKNNLTIAFTLLRKPFKENLLILEWIAGDSMDFFKSYNFEDSKNYSPLVMQSNRDKIREIISNAISKIKVNSFYDVEFIFQLRYDKSQLFSLDQLWNLSTHLVTDRKHIKTDTFNLNFVFSNEEDQESQLYHIYSLLPYLLFYTVDIVEAAMKRISELGEDTITIRKIMGFLAWVKEYYVQDNFERASQMENTLKELISDMNTSCEKCGSEILLDQAQLINICFMSKIECPSCGESIELE